MSNEHESIEFDVLFVGGGPANLSGAIRLMQLVRKNNREISVALIEKGSEIGSHQISGAVMNPRALAELIPDYEAQGCPIQSTVREDAFMYLTKNGAYKLPLVPPQMKNSGNVVISLSRFTAWLAEKVERLGVDLLPGFAGTKLLYDADNQTVTGVQTGDMGLDKNGEPKPNFEPGMNILAKVTVLGEGARGSLVKELDDKLGIGKKNMPQVYETGIKEVIQLPEDNYFRHHAANDIHTLGYPLGLTVPGGGFIYEYAEDKVGIGFLVGLGYEDAMVDPYETFIRFKRHPFVTEMIKGGKVIEQGARTVSTGGYYTMPTLAVGGAVIVGGAAGFQNTPALKGVHVSMKSGMLAAEAIFKAFEKNDFSQPSLQQYAERFEDSWAGSEIYQGRNFAQALYKKGLAKWFHLGAQQISKGRGVHDPMPIEPDHSTLKPVDSSAAESVIDSGDIEYDNELIVDRPTGVYLSQTLHREDEPSHILVRDRELCIDKCYPLYRSPCTRFCPANVYEIETGADGPKLLLNPSNCLHCKTCDIKDPFENITWTCPEGGEGPNYRFS